MFSSEITIRQLIQTSPCHFETEIKLSSYYLQLHQQTPMQRHLFTVIFTINQTLGHSFQQKLILYICHIHFNYIYRHYYIWERKQLIIFRTFIARSQSLKTYTKTYYLPTKVFYLDPSLFNDRDDFIVMEYILLMRLIFISR